jgi:hypothetical protein
MKHQAISVSMFVDDTGEAFWHATVQYWENDKFVRAYHRNIKTDQIQWGPSRSVESDALAHAMWHMTQQYAREQFCDHADPTKCRLEREYEQLPKRVESTT